MDYRKFTETYYIRLDRDDEIISCLLDLCKRETIASAIFSGIGGCGETEIQTFIPETGQFETQIIQNMLEMLSLMGNIIKMIRENIIRMLMQCFRIRKVINIYSLPVILNPLPSITQRKLNCVLL